MTNEPTRLLGSLVDLHKNSKTDAGTERLLSFPITSETSVTENITRIPNLTGTHTPIITPILDEHDLTHSKERYKKDFTHVSDLVYTCPRKYALALEMNQPFYKEERAQDRFVWAMGRALENHIRDSYIEHRAAEVYGKWTCHCPDEASRIGLYDDTDRCPTCRQKLNKYRELTLYDNHAQIVGNIDFLVQKNGRFVVVEFKSIHNKTNAYGKGFDDLDVPRPEHALQSLFYRHLLQANNYPVEDYTLIIYGNKQYTFRNHRSPYKEFKVLPADYEALFDVSMTFAHQIATYRNTEAMPPRWDACPNMNSKVAKECPFATRCFMRAS